MRRFLELVNNLSLFHQIGDAQQKRQIAEIGFSNLSLSKNTLYLEPKKWLLDTEKTVDVLCGGPQRDRTRAQVAIERLMREAEYLD